MVLLSDNTLNLFAAIFLVGLDLSSFRLRNDAFRPGKDGWNSVDPVLFLLFVREKFCSPVMAVLVSEIEPGFDFLECFPIRLAIQAILD